MSWSIDTSGHIHKLTINGEQMTFAEACGAFAKVESGLIRKRILEGWDLERAFTELPSDLKGMKLKERIAMVTKFISEGMTFDQMAVRFENQIKAKNIQVFCLRYNIEMEEPSDTALTGMEVPGIRLWSRSVDPKTEPSEGGVAFAETNNNTCRFPMWKEATGEASKLPCCGKHTIKGTLYCEEHNRRMGNYSSVRPANAHG